MVNLPQSSTRNGLGPAETGQENRAGWYADEDQNSLFIQGELYLAGGSLSDSLGSIAVHS